MSPRSETARRADIRSETVVSDRPEYHVDVARGLARSEKPAPVIKDPHSGKPLYRPGVRHDYIVEILNEIPDSDTERADHDAELLTRIDHGGKSIHSSSKPTTAARPMTTAFTDRTLRLREGQGTHRALMHDVPFEQKDKSLHGNCDCPVCKPHAVRPAGQSSHVMGSSTIHPAHLGSELVSPRPNPSSPRSPYNTGGGPSQNYDSKLMTGIFTDGAMSPRSPRTGTVDDTDDAAFRDSIGRKAKPRSISADPSSSAGAFKIGSYPDLEKAPYRRYKGADHTSFARDGSQMAISPRQSDPPAPIRISNCAKSNGDYKFAFSKHSEQVSLHWNQPLYRFEVHQADEDSHRLSRSKSVPPRNPVTAEHMSEKDGVHRSDRGERKRQFHLRGSEAGEVTNHELLDHQAKKERSSRLEGDHKFANLCSHTHEDGARSFQERKEVKDRIDRCGSRSMANALVWDD